MCVMMQAKEAEMSALQEHDRLLAADDKGVYQPLLASDIPSSSSVYEGQKWPDTPAADLRLIARFGALPLFVDVKCMGHMHKHVSYLPNENNSFQNFRLVT